jgi:Pyrroline-5-carboxylate reductase
LLKDGVMSPGGTTAAGYSALEEGNVRSSCINAIEKAYNKAKEL